MKKFLIVLLLIQIVVPVAVYAQAQQLFIIERSKNANIVRYDANVGDDGKIDQKKPVEGYWLLFAEKNGEKEKLSAFDKKAYGYKAVYNKNEDNYKFSLKAVSDRPMTLSVYDGIAKVRLLIADTDCFLQRVYVESKDGAFGIPKVSYYLLTGINVQTGETVEEKITVKK